MVLLRSDVVKRERERFLEFFHLLKHNHSRIDSASYQGHIQIQAMWWQDTNICQKNALY